MAVMPNVQSEKSFPQGWNVYRLSDLFDNGFQNGLFYEVSRKGKGVQIINVSDLYGKVPICEQELAKFDASANEIEHFRVYFGDLFFTRSSIVPSGIAMCNVYCGKSENNAVFDSHLIKLSINQNVVNPVFLCMQCRMPYCRSYFVSVSKTAIMTTIDQSGIADCTIIAPEKKEQDKIVDAIKSFDTYIDSLTELIEKKRNIRDGALEELVSGRTRLEGFRGEWIEYSFDSFFTLLSSIYSVLTMKKVNIVQKVEN